MDYEVEAIKTADYRSTCGCMACRLKFMSKGFGCDLGCTLALSPSHSAATPGLCGLWRYYFASANPVTHLRIKISQYYNERNSPATDKIA